ncbi:MAG: MaoC family dehydratase [Firmicutes bacterium]|jgi:3-hydroxybutyryl-CoA dehydratase|nr:MaoC family dehydratase [Bacillota bacterium]MBQ7677367.1 MaoC family dehydratase [Lachnospiraceae bacterium]MCR4710723.1 MaoC family dehydratase [Clostridia bacterium]
MENLFYIPYEEIRVGDKAARESVISDDIVLRFSELIGDTNSFHVSDENAAKTVFRTRIAHGVHLLSFVSTLIGQKLPGFGTIYCSQELKFMKPVYIGETITTEVEVLEKLSHQRLRMRTVIRDSAGDIVMDGVAVIKTYR